MRIQPPSAYRPTIRKASKRLIVLICVLSFLFRLDGQNKTDLEKQRKQKQKEIELTKKLLANTREKRGQTLEYLGVLKMQIRSREELIGTLQNEIHLLSMQIDRESDVVMALESDVDALKHEYARLLYYMYKNHSSYNLLSFIFASGSFNQAFMRLKFIRFYTGYRNRQITLIKKTEEFLNSKVTTLTLQQNEKKQALLDLDEQKKSLEEDKVAQGKLATKLKGEEDKLRKQLKNQQRIADKLDKAIRDIIEKEIRESRKTKPSSTKPELTLAPDALKLSNDFASNRTRLPWPVDKGVISEHFGRHPHPTLEHVEVVNNGIRIRTLKGANVKAIFAGEVTAIVNIPGANASIIIRHGNYLTVYSNLDNVTVTVGEKIKTGQSLGLVAESTITGEPELGLQIWQGDQKMNPEAWIAPK
jgi:septal ring factor EnvC (AmiA/AmiB activator)